MIKLLKNYLTSGEDFWPLTHRRNVSKINNFLKKGSCGYELNEYINSILVLAKLRNRFNSKHVYLINTGSSGSHWIEAMLGLLPDFHNGGEIYLPQIIKKHLSQMSAEDAAIFLDCIYQVHTGGIYKDSISATLSNSAHLADHTQLSQYSPNKKTILLLRNPIDVVISRTFRKNEYKKDIAPNLNEKEYLAKNCNYVENFYKHIKDASFDLIIKYEDFVSSPTESLQLLVSNIGLEASKEDISNSVDKTSKHEVEQAVEKGENAITNIYLGERKNYDWAKDYLTERMKGLLIRYNYQ